MFRLATAAPALVLQLAESPVDDAHQVPATPRLAGEQHLSPGLVGGLEDDDVVGASAEDPRGFQAGRAGTDDDGLAAAAAAWLLLRYAVSGMAGRQVASVRRGSGSQSRTVLQMSPTVRPWDTGRRAAGRAVCSR
jgi:hypothetical protein